MRKLDGEKIPRGRAKDTIEDLHADGVVGSEGWTKPRQRRKKSFDSFSNVSQ
jgi:hypothetical protein